MKWQRCPRCDSNRVIKRQEAKQGMGCFTILFMVSAAIITFFIVSYVTNFIASVIFFFASSNLVPGVISLIASIVAVVFVVKKFQEPYKKNMGFFFAKIVN